MSNKETQYWKRTLGRKLAEQKGEKTQAELSTWTTADGWTRGKKARGSWKKVR